MRNNKAAQTQCAGGGLAMEGRLGQQSGFIESMGTVAYVFVNV